MLVGMEAEDEASAPRRGASDGDVCDWFYAKMRATLARERLDTQAFHERLAVVERMLKEGRFELLDDLKPFAKTVGDDIQNYGTIPAFTMRRLAESTTSGNMTFGGDRPHLLIHYDE